MYNRKIFGIIDIAVAVLAVFLYAAILTVGEMMLPVDDYHVLAMSIGGFGIGLAFCGFLFNAALATRNNVTNRSRFFILVTLAYLSVCLFSPEFFLFLGSFGGFKIPVFVEEFMMFSGYYILFAFFLSRLPGSIGKFILISLSFLTFMVLFFALEGHWRLFSFAAPLILTYLLITDLDKPFVSHARLYYLLALLVVGEAFTISLIQCVFNTHEAVYGLQSSIAASLSLILSFYSSDSLLELKGKGDASRRQQEKYLRARSENLAGQSMPHFLFNSLTFVQASFHSSYEEGQRALALLQKNIDNFIITDKTELVPFTEEIAFIDDYIELTSLRKDYKVQVNYDLAETDFKVPPLSLQIFIENAMRYGGLEKREDGSLWISSKKTVTSIVITIKDNGDGFDPNQVTGPLHTGGNNARYRLEYLLGASAEISSAPGKGTVVTVTIPY